MMGGRYGTHVAAYAFEVAEALGVYDLLSLALQPLVGTALGSIAVEGLQTRPQQIGGKRLLPKHSIYRNHPGVPKMLDWKQTRKVGSRIEKPQESHGITQSTRPPKVSRLHRLVCLAATHPSLGP